jgi:CHAT domain-containing protein
LALRGSFSDAVLARNSIIAQTPSINSPVSVITKAIALEAQGKDYYAQGKLTEAIASWQQAIEVYNLEGDLIGRSRVLSNLALAYQQLGDWEQAEQAIQNSLDILASYPIKEIEDPSESVLALQRRATANPTKVANQSQFNRVLAQTLNNQGVLQLAQGDSSTALITWQRATELYKQIGDELGVIRSQINQASAFKALGLYRRALKILTEVNQVVATQPNSLAKAVELRSYGDTLRLVGKLDRAEEVLQESLAIISQLQSSGERVEVSLTCNEENCLESVKTVLALGNLMKAKGDRQKALEFYQQGLIICQTNQLCTTSSVPLQINLAQLSLLIVTKDWQSAEKLLPEIKPKIANLASNRSNIYYKLNFTHLCLELTQKRSIKTVELANFLSSTQIEEILADVIQQAEYLGDYRAKSYGLGLQGEVFERLEAWNDSEKFSKQALQLAQTINAPEVSYLWQWQLGRIWQKRGKTKEAIAYYSEAVATLKTLSQDLVAIDPDLQYTFRESVEPVYRELVSLLLHSQDGKAISQESLVQARDTIESLQLAELHNFFREACLDVRPMPIERIDRQAAVIYPIILGDRTEVILSLPGKPLIHYATSISQTELEQVSEQLRKTLVIRSRREFYQPAQKLYDWLIRPALSDLVNSGIKTIVFVLDGTLRNIPMSALYDGKHYLIEQYNIALTPGLQLLAPLPVKKVKLETLAAGLTEQRQGFASLNYVNLELEKIQKQIDSVVLLNKEFTEEAIKEKIQFSNFPIVHIATHGQFSSSLEETFLLTWDSRIKLEELDKILQTRTNSEQKAIELLVLSACETATGDKWAALGLAGTAVKAGARSTLATLWSVNDRATAELMGQFYQELAKKAVTRAQAVRQAQLNLLKNPRYKHPFYWAPYVLLGNWL